MNFLDPGRPATCSRSLFSSIRREDLEIRVRLLEPETFIVRSGLARGCGCCTYCCCCCCFLGKNASELKHDDDDGDGDDVIMAVKMEEDLEDNNGPLNARAASTPKIIDRCNVGFVDDGNDVEIQMERRVNNNHVARHDDAGVVRVDFLIIVIIKILFLVSSFSDPCDDHCVKVVIE
jgi:hypothetical protein